MTSAISQNSSFALTHTLAETKDPAGVVDQLKEYSTEARCSVTKARWYRTGAFVLSIIPIIGWFAALHLSMLETDEQSRQKALHGKMYTCLKDKEEQIVKDLQRGYLLILNGKRYEISDETRKTTQSPTALKRIAEVQARTFIKDLIKIEMPDEEKFKIINLAHQGLFAKLLECKSQLIAKVAEQPVTRNPATAQLELGGIGARMEYKQNFNDLSPDKKVIEFVIKEGQSTVASCYKAGVSVEDETADAYETPVFEMDASFKIDLKSDSMTVKPTLTKVHLPAAPQTR